MFLCVAELEEALIYHLELSARQKVYVRDRGTSITTLSTLS
jgi:hypothetical protein